MKNVLVAVVGLSPQVVTETLFALHQQQRPVDAIHLITTRQGKEEINAHLLSPADGKYYQYLKTTVLIQLPLIAGFTRSILLKMTRALRLMTSKEKKKMRGC